MDHRLRMRLLPALRNRGPSIPDLIVAASAELSGLRCRGFRVLIS